MALYCYKCNTVVNPKGFPVCPECAGPLKPSPKDYVFCFVWAIVMSLLAVAIYVAPILLHTPIPRPDNRLIYDVILLGIAWLPYITLRSRFNQ